MPNEIVHHPAVFHVWGVPLSGFGLAVALGFVLGGYIAEIECRRKGVVPSPVSDIVSWSVVGFIIGAKVYYALLTHSLESLVSRGGFVYWGGFAGGVAASAILLRVKRVSFLRVADACSPGLAAAYAVGRTGCWAVGDDYGKPWPGGWLAVKFPEGTPPSTVGNLAAQFGVAQPEHSDPNTVIAVYPTQLLEVALGLLMFFVLWRLRTRACRDGWLFGGYCVLAGVERLAVEFFRAKDDRLLPWGLSLAQLFALVMIFIGGALMLASMRARAEPAHGAT